MYTSPTSKLSPFPLPCSKMPHHTLGVDAPLLGQVKHDIDLWYVPGDFGYWAFTPGSSVFLSLTCPMPLPA